MMNNWLLPVVRDWAEWAAIFTDVTLWRPVVETVWQADEQLRAASGVSELTRVEGGYPGTCAVFLVDVSAVIKFFPPMVAHDFERELTAYRLIRGHISRIPNLLSHGTFLDQIEWPYLAVSFLPGDAWRVVRARIEPAQAMEIMSELGRIVRDLHNIPLPPSGSWPSASAWEMMAGSRLAQAGDDLRRGTALSEAVIAEIEGFLARVYWFGESPCLLHSDLTEDHLLVVESGDHWTLAGLIDWADAEVGPPAYDWVALWFSICHRDPALLRAFFHGYGAPVGDSVQELAAMTYLHRFGPSIISEVLTPDEQRAIASLNELNRSLFGMLPTVIP